VFYDNEKNEFLLEPEEVIAFVKKEMLPKPTEYGGKPLFYDGGKFVIQGTDKEVDLKR